jgi:hypothetical protein
MQGTVREAIRANKIVQEGNDPFVGVSAAFPIVDTQRKTFTIRLEIKNFGKTPATDFEVSPMLFLNFGMIPIPKPQGTVPGTLFPDQPTVTEITVGEPYFGEIMNINNAFFYKVTLRYRSVATRQEFEPCYRGQYAPEIKLNAFKDLGCK